MAWIFWLSTSKPLSAKFFERNWPHWAFRSCARWIPGTFTSRKQSGSKTDRPKFSLVVFPRHTVEQDAATGQQLCHAKSSLRGIASRHQLGPENYLHSRSRPHVVFF